MLILILKMKGCRAEAIPRMALCAGGVKRKTGTEDDNRI